MIILQYPILNLDSTHLSKEFQLILHFFLVVWEALKQSPLLLNIPCLYCLLLLLKTETTHHYHLRMLDFPILMQTRVLCFPNSILNSLFVIFLLRIILLIPLQIQGFPLATRWTHLYGTQTISLYTMLSHLNVRITTFCYSLPNYLFRYKSGQINIFLYHFAGFLAIAFILLPKFWLEIYNIFKNVCKLNPKRKFNWDGASYKSLIIFPCWEIRK